MNAEFIVFAVGEQVVDAFDPNSTAAEADLRQGDILSRVDGVDVSFPLHRLNLDARTSPQSFPTCSCPCNGTALLYSEEEKLNSQELS